MTTDGADCMCPGCYCRENHEKVEVQHPDGYLLTIDRGLAELANVCIDSEVKVGLSDLCCENMVMDTDHYVVLDFVAVDDLERFLTAIVHDETLYRLALDDQESEWMYRLAPFDLGMEAHIVAGERLEVRQAAPDVSCEVSVIFPVEHLQMVMDALNALVRGSNEH